MTFQPESHTADGKISVYDRKNGYFVVKPYGMTYMEMELEDGKI